MTIIYIIVDRDTCENLGSFVTSLTLSEIRSLEVIANTIFQNETNCNTKIKILFELIEKEDIQFKECVPKVLKI